MSDHPQPYLSRPPERLVLGGYRHWLRGCETGSIEHWNAAFAMYAETLGGRNGPLAVATLSKFVGTLGRCANCPLAFFPTGSDHVCRDECLVLGLISGIQNGDEDAQQCAAAGLTCRLLRDQVIVEAGEFALTLRSFGQMLMPISADVIAELVHKPAPAGPAREDQPTLH